MWMSIRMQGKSCGMWMQGKAHMWMQGKTHICGMMNGCKKGTTFSEMGQNVDVYQDAG